MCFFLPVFDNRCAPVDTFLMKWKLALNITRDSRTYNDVISSLLVRLRPIICVPFLRGSYGWVILELESAHILSESHVLLDAMED